MAVTLGEGKEKTQSFFLLLPLLLELLIKG